MTSHWRRFAKASWRLPLLLIMPIAALILIDVGFSRLETWRDVASRDSDFNWWSFLLVGLILSSGGLVAGLTILNRALTRAFDWRQALVLGIVPGLLAMTWPMFVWGWPLTGMNSPLWDFRIQFLKDSYFGAACILVGLAIASGFAPKDRK